METSSLLSFSKQIPRCSWLISLTDWISCDLASSFKFLRTVSQTHWVICCQIKEAFLLTARSAWKHTRTVSTSTCLSSIYVVTWQPISGPVTLAACVISVNATHECALWETVCVCSDSLPENIHGSSHEPDSMSLYYRGLTVAHPHTLRCVCVCYLVSVLSLSTLSEPPGRTWLTPLHQSLLSAESCPLPQQPPHPPRQHRHSRTTPEARHREHNESDRESERRRWN